MYPTCPTLQQGPEPGFTSNPLPLAIFLHNREVQLREDVHSLILSLLEAIRILQHEPRLFSQYSSLGPIITIESSDSE